MTAFRPCIDLHQGKVKQIVGGTLSDSGEGLRTNFVSEHDAAWFAELYRKELALEWLGEILPRWSEPCPIVVKVGPELGAGGVDQGAVLTTQCSSTVSVTPAWPSAARG